MTETFGFDPALYANYRVLRGPGDTAAVTGRPRIGNRDFGFSLGIFGTFLVFARISVMTQGGPLRSTTSVVLLMYEEGFRWWRMGFAAAIAFVLFIVILLATLVQFRLAKDRT